MSESLEVREGCVVKIGYTLQLKDGVQIELPGQPSPIRFTHGGKKLPTGLQDALTGMEVGQECEITLAADEAFGEPQPPQKIKMNRSQFPETLKLYPGRRVPVQNLRDGTRKLYFVSTVDPEHVTLVNNHPLAGEELRFTVTILNVAAVS
jgi:FKBP-type peptidyl-prolyl cis-trans isomerase 2